MTGLRASSRRTTGGSARPPRLERERELGQPREPLVGAEGNGIPDGVVPLSAIAFFSTESTVSLPQGGDIGIRAWSKA